MLTELRNIAASTMEKYPQYNGHFDNYKLVKIKRKLVTKMGVAFLKDDVAIARPEPDKEFEGFVTVWSFRTEVDTSVPAKIVKYL